MGLLRDENCRDMTALVARVLLVTLFLLSGFDNITGFAGTAAYIASKGLPLPVLGVALAITVEVGASLLVLLGWRARAAALGIGVFSLAAGLLFHAYWADVDAAARSDNFINFWKNVAITGGFLMVVAFGPGRFSVDRG
jgi:putative oxidoreductase